MPAATDRLLAAVEAIYDTAPNPSLWPSALDKIAGCFDDVGALLQWQKEDATFGVNDLFGADLPKGRRNDIAAGIMTAGEFDIFAEILRAERQAAILRVAADPLDEHIRTFRLFGGRDVGNRSHGLAAKRDDLLRTSLAPP